MCFSAVMLTLFLLLQPEQRRSCLIFPRSARSEVSTGVKCKKKKKNETLFAV